MGFIRFQESDLGADKAQHTFPTDAVKAQIGIFFSVRVQNVIVGLPVLEAYRFLSADIKQKRAWCKAYKLTFWLLLVRKVSKLNLSGF